jgi:hypothetical protein
LRPGRQLYPSLNKYNEINKGEPLEMFENIRRTTHELVVDFE